MSFVPRWLKGIFKAASRDIRASGWLKRIVKAVSYPRFTVVKARSPRVKRWLKRIVKARKPSFRVVRTEIVVLNGFELSLIERFDELSLFKWYVFQKLIGNLFQHFFS